MILYQPGKSRKFESSEITEGEEERVSERKYGVWAFEQKIKFHDSFHKDNLLRNTLRIALAKCNIKILKELVKHYVQPEKITDTMELSNLKLHDAVYNGDLESVKLLIQQGANVDCLDKYFNAPPLLFAVINKNMEMINLLIDQGADIDLQYENVWIDRKSICNILDAAVKLENIEIVDLLIKRGVNVVDDNGTTVLYEAILTHNLDLIKLIISHGANVNFFRPSEKVSVTAFFAAMLDYDPEQNVKIVTLLLDSGADINLEPENGDRPLTYAVKRNMFAVFKLLVERGAEVNYDVKQYYTTISLYDLIYICAKRYKENNQITDYLIQRGLVCS